MSIYARGFTLIEALVTLAITAILLGVGVPAMTRLLQSQQLQSSSYSLASTFAFARSESIKRRCPVLIESIGGQWAKGWRVYADLNGDGLQAAAEPLLLTGPALPNGVIIQGNTPVQRYIRYTPTGSAKMQNGAFQAGTLSICHQSGEQPVRRLILSATGRLRRATGPAGPC
jgi:type IV fimbrial biogenesis protein FimT